ncbi:MAG: hypothetical protein ACJ789_19410 [Thermomicrobiales bacterium]
MEDRWFDEFATAVSKTTSRRQLLRMVAAGTLVSLFGRNRALRAIDDLASAQSSDVPLPNFPFLVALPTDPGLEEYELDFELTGPPTRIADVAALPSMPQDWLDTVSQCRGAYYATITRGKKDGQNEPQRSITTILFDLGTTDNAVATHSAYVAKLLSEGTRQQLTGGTKPAGSNVVLVGCQGGCVNFSSPANSGTTPSDEAAAVGQRDRFIFDTRVREFSTQSITGKQLAGVGLRVDRKLSAVGTVGTAGTAVQASIGPVKQAMRAVSGPAKFVQRTLLQSSSSIKQTLASKNTLPIFAVNGLDAPKTAVQWLSVSDGAIVVKFGQSAFSAAADQRNANDVVYGLTLKQPIALSQPFHDGYDLTLAATQYVFAGEDEARKFLEETKARIDRARPELTLQDSVEVQDERSYAYQDDEGAGSPNGPAFGLLTHIFVPFGSLAIIIAVDLAAVPRSPGQAPLSADDLRKDLGPLVDQIVSSLSNCLINPDSCPTTGFLNAQALLPTPTPTTCSAPQQNCGDVCVDTRSDPNNCGDCGNGCGNGACCSGICVDTTSDPAHCGDCQTVCPQGTNCSGGTCGCASGTTSCNNVCVDLTSDANNCGDCGIVCPSGSLCTGGKCSCPDSSPPCGQSCCALGLTCTNGQCLCPDSTPPCGGTCCQPGLVCAGGVCACPSGTTDCSGTCLDLSSDPNNCGSCGFTCDGLSCCGGTCVDTNSDPANCGGCGMPCPVGQYCFGGTCGLG